MIGEYTKAGDTCFVQLQSSNSSKLDAVYDITNYDASNNKTGAFIPKPEIYKLDTGVFGIYVQVDKYKEIVNMTGVATLKPKYNFTICSYNGGSKIACNNTGLSATFNISYTNQATDPLPKDTPIKTSPAVKVSKKVSKIVLTATKLKSKTVIIYTKKYHYSLKFNSKGVATITKSKLKKIKAKNKIKKNKTIKLTIKSSNKKIKAFSFKFKF
jgi:hypothetical protein